MNDPSQPDARCTSSSLPHQLALYFLGLQLPHCASQGVDAESGAAEKGTDKEIDEGLVRVPSRTGRSADDRPGEVSPHPDARARIELHRLGLKAGPRQNERTLLDAARQTNRGRRYRRRLRPPAANLDAGTWGIGDDADLLVTPVVQSRTTLREKDYRDEVPEVHAICSFGLRVHKGVLGAGVGQRGSVRWIALAAAQSDGADHHVHQLDLEKLLLAFILPFLRSHFDDDAREALTGGASEEESIRELRHRLGETEIAGGGLAGAASVAGGPAGATHSPRERGDCLGFLATELNRGLERLFLRDQRKSQKHESDEHGVTCSHQISPSSPIGARRRAKKGHV